MLRGTCRCGCKLGHSSWAMCPSIHIREPIASPSLPHPIPAIPASHVPFILALHALLPTGSGSPGFLLPAPFPAAVLPSLQMLRQVMRAVGSSATPQISLLGVARLPSSLSALSTCPAPTGRQTSTPSGSWQNTGRENGALTRGWWQSSHIWLDVRREGWFNILAGGQVWGDAAPRGHGGCGIPWNR